MTALVERGIGFKSLTENIDTTTSGGKLIFHIFGALVYQDQRQRPPPYDRPVTSYYSHAGLVLKNPSLKILLACPCELSSFHRAYWSEVGQQTRKTVEFLMPEEWSKPVDEMRLFDTFANGAIGNEQARWVEQFYSGRTKAWFLSFINWHHAEHLFGEALSVRSQAGIALGL
jgi:hypothetical protein